MSAKIRSSATNDEIKTNSAKMPDLGLGTKKTVLVFVIVVGCFAVLWPKVFYPMLVGSANQHMQPSAIDKRAGCCDVISDADMNTIKILSQICTNVIHPTEEKPLSGKEIIAQCKTEVLQTCGIDISAVLQEQVRLGYTVMQILSDIRSLNGSLCLKYNFGVAPWRLGVPHRITIRDAINVKQERSPQLKPEMVHPAFRERGRAIPHPSMSPVRSTSTRRVVEGKPGPLPGMRPPMGGAGHVVPPSQKGASSMGVIMPLYTIGIVIFFTYTLMKVLFKKQPDVAALYPSVVPDSTFRADVFESEQCRKASRYSREGVSSKLVVNAMSALLDEVDLELEMRRKASEIVNQDEHTLSNGSLSNRTTEKPEAEDQTSVKVVGMETTASCEGGQKWSRPESPVTPPAHVFPPESSPPPQEIYLEGALPAQSQLLVAESAAEPQPNDESSDPAVVLAGKMTLSVISMGSSQDEAEEAEQNDKIDTNGFENGDELLDESKYTTVSGTTAAENELSDDENGPEEIADEVGLEDGEIEDFVADVIEEAKNKLEEEDLGALDATIVQTEDAPVEATSERNNFDVQKLVDELISQHESDLMESVVSERLLSELLKPSDENVERDANTAKTFENEPLFADLNPSTETETDDLMDSTLTTEAAEKFLAEILKTSEPEETEIADDNQRPVFEGPKPDFDTQSIDSQETITGLQNGGHENEEGADVANNDGEDEYEYEIEEIEVDSDYDGDDEIIEVVERVEGEEAKK